METLRQPLEDGVVTVSRVNGTVSFPCKFMLVAAMNPANAATTATLPSLHLFAQRGAAVPQPVSGPLLDRIDLQVEVTPVAIGRFRRCGLRSRAPRSASG